MASFEYTGRGWYHTGGSTSQWLFAEIQTSNPPIYINDDHWKYSINVRVASSTSSVNISSLSGAIAYLRCYSDSGKNNLVSENSIPISGSVVSWNPSTGYFGPLAGTAKGNYSALYFTLDVDLNGVTGSNGLPGIEDVGYGNITHLYVYGIYHVEDIPLSPNITSFSWDETKIKEGSISFRVTSNQDIKSVKVTSIEILNGTTSVDKTTTEITPTLGGSGKSRTFTISSSNWSKIEYARYYRVMIKISNSSGAWNTNQSYSQCDARTGNHKPIITAAATPHLDWYKVDWSSDIPSSIYTGYPTSTEGTLKTGDSAGVITCTNITPYTAVTFKLKVKANRFYTESKYGSYVSDETSITIKTLSIANINSFSNFNFADPVKYTLVNYSERGCSVGFYKDGTKIWEDPKGSTITNSEITRNMNQTELDNLYKLFGNSNSVKITLKVTTSGLYGTYTSTVEAFCILTGNAKTAHVGDSSNRQRRANVWIVDSSNKPRRCVVWIGDSNNKPRRCI